MWIWWSEPSSSTREHSQWESHIIVGKKSENRENDSWFTRRARLLFLFSKQLKKQGKYVFFIL